ncbi:5-formyltetrahydrofolate cyclo-ligase [Acidocella sp.]|uniref:5-formyltetrahydrofolate cyclo-ligase n=1 Tax=Acidocella sp. TaxID=50710 RepID=UPI003D094B7E
MSQVSEQKASLRRLMLEKREKQQSSLGANLAEHVLASGLIPHQAIIGGFMPMRGEIDIMPLLHSLHQRGQLLALPETPPPGQALIFRAWTPTTKMLPGRYNTQHPDAPLLTPDFLLIPLLAFDVSGNRLGYGGGYYDRTLAALPGVFRLGCAYAIQQTAAIPTEPTDLPLHALASETGITLFRQPPLKPEHP